MITINEQTLKSLGLTISDDAKPAFIEHLMATLEQRIGVAISEQLDDQELEQLVKLTDAGDDAATEAFIKENVPDYDEIVQDEYDILMGEIAEQSDNINQEAA